MNTDTSLHASSPECRPQLARRDLGFRAIGQVTSIALLAALVFAAAALAGCEKIAPSATGTGAAFASEPALHTGAGKAAPQRFGFDWRQADPVTYSPEDWLTDPDRPIEY